MQGGGNVGGRPSTETATQRGNWAQLADLSANQALTKHGLYGGRGAEQGKSAQQHPRDSKSVLS